MSGKKYSSKIEGWGHQTRIVVTKLSLKDDGRCRQWAKRRAEANKLFKDLGLAELEVLLGPKFTSITGKQPTATLVEPQADAALQMRNAQPRRLAQAMAVDRPGSSSVLSLSSKSVNIVPIVPALPQPGSSEAREQPVAGTKRPAEDAHQAVENERQRTGKSGRHQ